MVWMLVIAAQTLKIAVVSQVYPPRNRSQEWRRWANKRRDRNETAQRLSRIDSA